MDADRLDPPFPWIGKTVFERWGMREDEGEKAEHVPAHHGWPMVSMGLGGCRNPGAILGGPLP